MAEANHRLAQSPTIHITTASRVLAQLRARNAVKAELRKQGLQGFLALEGGTRQRMQAAALSNVKYRRHRIARESQRHRGVAREHRC